MRLILIMWIPVLVKHLYIEVGLWITKNLNQVQKFLLTNMGFNIEISEGRETVKVLQFSWNQGPVSILYKATVLQI